MFNRKDNICAVAIMLSVIMFCWGSGITQAALIVPSPITGSATKVNAGQWTPMTDSEMESVKGGFIHAIVVDIAVGILVCVIWAAAVYVFTPSDPPAQAEQASDIVRANQTVVDFSDNGVTVCGDRNTVIVAAEGSTVNINVCPIDNTTVNITIITPP